MSKNQKQIFKDFAELYQLTDRGLELLGEAKDILDGEKMEEKTPNDCIVCGKPSAFGGICTIAHQVDYYGE